MEIQNEPQRIDEIKDSAREAEKESAKFMEPGTKIKKGRGRPKKETKTKDEPAPQAAQPVSQTPQIPTSEFMKPVLQIMSSAAAGWAGDPRAQMTPEETDGMALGFGALFDKYFPGGIEKYGPEITCLFFAGSYGLRIWSLKQAKEKADAEKINFANKVKEEIDRPIQTTEPLN